MKPIWILLLLCMCARAVAADGVEKKTESADVYTMRTVTCAALGDATPVPIQPGLADWQPAAEESCMEYGLRTDKIEYVVTPRSPVLLMLGSTVQIRAVRRELLLRGDDGAREIHCRVVSMKLRRAQSLPEVTEPRRTLCLDRSGKAAPCER